MPLPHVTLEGRILDEPQLRFTPSGAAVLNFRLACSEKKKDNGDYGDSLYVNIGIWKDEAEPAAEALAKGDFVLVTGQLFTREYEKKDGGKGSSLEVKWAHASKPIRAPRQGQPSQQQGYGGHQGYQQAPADPWAAPQGERPF